MSILNILLFAPASYSFDVTSFSTANTTPSLPRKATAVLLSKMTYYYWYEDIRRRLTRCFRRLSWHIRLGILCHQERTAKLTNRTEITDESKHQDRRFKSVNLKYITPVPIELIVSLREWLVKSLTQPLRYDKRFQAVADDITLAVDSFHLFLIGNRATFEFFYNRLTIFV